MDRKDRESDLSQAFEDAVTNVTDEAKKGAFVTLVRENQRRPETHSEVGHNHCGLINAETVIALARQYQIPGMEFTLEVDRHLNPFHYDKTWNFHSVGIVLLEGEPENDQAIYAVIDQSTHEEVGHKKKPFIRVGTLHTISEELHSFFGGNWDLDSQPKNPDFRVAARVRNAQKIIERQEQLSYGKHFWAEGKKGETRPLGLKVLDTGIAPENPAMRQRIRDQFTYPHA